MKRILIPLVLAGFVLGCASSRRDDSDDTGGDPSDNGNDNTTAQCSAPEQCPNIVCPCADGTPVNYRGCSNGRCEGSSACGKACENHGGTGNPTDPGPVGGRLCVAGDSYSCTYTAKGSWTGTECCVDDVSQCVAGDSYSCTYTAKGKWTGAKCCVAANKCVEGDSYSCTYTAKGAWTGALCCVSQTTCTTGDSYSCTYTAKGAWTGKYCCL